jgi:hypothetical protein
VAGALLGVIVEWILADDLVPPADVARGVCELLRRPR